MARLLAPQDEDREHIRPQSFPSCSVRAIGTGGDTRATRASSWTLPVSFENRHSVISYGVDPTTLNAEAQLENAESAGAPTGSFNTLTPPALSFWFVYLVTVTYTANFTVVIPTSIENIEKLGGDKKLAGFVVGVYCICGGLSNIPQSKILKTVSLKSFLGVVLFLYVVGNCLCALAQAGGSIYLFILGRLVTGAIGGPQIAGTYVARAYDLQERSSRMVLNASANGIGYAMGPFVSALGGFICDCFDSEGKVLNRDTAGSWIMAILSFGFMFCTGPLFTEPPPFVTQASSPPSVTQASSEERKSCCAGCTWFTIPVVVSYASILCTAMIIASWETHCQLVAQSEWDWNIMKSALFLAAINLILVPATMWGSKIAKKLSDRAAIVTCASLQLPSMIFLFNFVREANFVGVGLYSLGSALVLLFVQMQRGFLQSIITKQVAASSRQTAIGYFSLIWLCGRGIGAFIGDGIGADDIYTSVLLGLGCLQLIIFATSYKKLALDTTVAK